MTVRLALIATTLLLTSCDTGIQGERELVLTNGFVYSMSWGDPDGDGTPAPDAPYENGIWHPDAEAIYISGDRIIYVGTNEGALTQARKDAQVIDLLGANVFPGAIESHGHLHELGEHHEQLDLEGIDNKSSIVDMVVEKAAKVPPGEWIIGWGWDEGAWANDLPDWNELNQRVPDHPVVLKGRRGFGAWANRLAVEAAGFTADAANPDGGELVRNTDGELTGVLLNNAVDALYDSIPEQSLEQKKRILRFGLDEMAASGFVATHHAGVRDDYMPAYEALAQTDELPIRVHLMLAAVADNRALTDRFLSAGPTEDVSQMLQVRGVKAYYDGSLGSRGARLLEEYADMPGHRGVSGSDYGFDTQVVEDLMVAGFQVGIHAIGDEGNRAVLDFYEGVFERHPETMANQHRVEHAQVVHPDDFPRFSDLNLVASMEPGHAVEDSPWAQERLGPDRVKGAYAWRTLRRSGARVMFNSDYSGTDHSLFYGIYAAITRKAKDGTPEGGWFPDQVFTPEEAVRAYTVWPASASGILDQTGTIEPGKWADLTVLSIDPLNIAQPLVGSQDGSVGVGITPDELLDGKIEFTIVAGEIVFQR
jgi:predicted amidohydrolase YtcJ